MKIPSRSSVAHLFRATVIIIFVVGLFFPAYLLSNEWRETTTPRQWSFPRDHGSHPEYRTEWWYFTGNLNDDRGKRYGYQLTFFRYGLALTTQTAIQCVVGAGHLLRPLRHNGCLEECFSLHGSRLPRRAGSCRARKGPGWRCEF